MIEGKEVSEIWLQKSVAGLSQNIWLLVIKILDLNIEIFGKFSKNLFNLIPKNRGGYMLLTDLIGTVGRRNFYKSYLCIYALDTMEEINKI